MTMSPCGSNDLPYAALEILFLDVGNTVLSMDFDLLCAELRERGARIEVAALRRAEARARPIVSAAIRDNAGNTSFDPMRLYLRAMLAALIGEDGRAEALAEDLTAWARRHPVDRLWCGRLPGVEDALAALRDMGLRLVAVSNSDGTAERSLVRTGLRPFFEAVCDSRLVGFEKPDPRIFRHALDLARGRPETTLHVGDMYHVDVAGARAAGVHALLLDPFGDWDGVDCARAADLGELAARLRAARR
ncbi:MAG: HAD family hydrolase [Planctomycetes bacterium]|nr:HAD family hydrolase [Planctomycetota bacterium]